MTKYETIKEQYHNMTTPGIFYAFSEEQLIEGMKKNGYTDRAGLVSDGCGGIGTREAFQRRREQFQRIAEQIKKECKPSEVFACEWWNHECGYTCDDSRALAIVREYFPKYKPTKKTLHDLRQQWNAIN